MKKEEHIKDLDHVFKEGLENPIDEIGYNDADWNALEGMLDAEKKPWLIIYLRPIITGIAAAILLGFGLMLYNGQFKGSTKKPGQDVAVVMKHYDTSTPITQQAKPVTNMPVATASPAVNTIAQQQKPTTKVSNIAAVATTNALSVQQKLIAIKLRKPVLQKHAGQALAPDGQFIAANQPKADNPAVNSAQKDPAVNNGANNTIVKTDGDNGNTSAATNNTLIAATKTNPNNASTAPVAPAATPPTVDNGTAAILAAAKPAIKKTALPAFKPQYLLSIIGAPEINGVGTLDGSSKGFNVGLLFTAEVFKKFSVTTGLNYSKKPYKVDFADYKTTYVFKSNPTQITADCRLLDIPINVGYKIYSNARSNITVGTGLSSYIMTHESYDYVYPSGTYVGGAGAPTDYAVKSPGKYLFSILNLNASYQYQIDPKVGISIQPYLKVPLADVGYSLIKMESGGVAVGLHWTINAKQKGR